MHFILIVCMKYQIDKNVVKEWNKRTCFYFKIYFYTNKCLESHKTKVTS